MVCRNCLGDLLLLHRSSYGALRKERSIRTLRVRTVRYSVWKSTFMRGLRWGCCRCMVILQTVAMMHNLLLAIHDAIGEARNRAPY